MAIQIPKISSFSGMSDIRLRYRHVNQGEIWQAIQMTETGKEATGTKYVATIPAEYTDSVFPLQYYFQPGDSVNVWLLPSLERPVNGQPYFVVRQA